ncbi:neuropilin and tolloid-like protein 2-like [Caerostris extrusa]|uniref:Neuropilin and tolloid-like protein 2-like n=1 Tax=Caerostris extrusa TaxID=172846 RepID=A0AAV4PTA5_CAEEX|nr:neuropilin and tolloid-like protein 2-like [Caerostris extrusa]
MRRAWKIGVYCCSNKLRSVAGGINQLLHQVKANPSHGTINGMYVNFQKYDLRHPNNCDVNFIDVYEETLSDDTRMAQFCGTATEPQKSDGNLVYVRYFAQGDAIKDGKFEIVYTAFRESDKCIESEFSCDDGTCIDKSLKCNKMYNCKYRYDEDAALCTPAMTASRMLTSEHMITILVVFFALVVAMCASIVITCYNKVKDRREKKREYKMRRSKEVSVEGEMDRVLANMDPGLEAALAAQAAEIGAAREEGASAQVDGRRGVQWMLRARMLISKVADQKRHNVSKTRIFLAHKCEIGLCNQEYDHVHPMAIIITQNSYESEGILFEKTAGHTFEGYNSRPLTNFGIKYGYPIMYLL